MPRADTTQQPAVADSELADLALTLERSLSWLRRALRPAQWNAVALSTLEAVDRLGPQRVTDLVARERITQPGMTGVVARLETAGLVSRRADAVDGRVTLVHVTPAGREYLLSMHDRRAAVLAGHLGGLAADQQRSLLAAAGALEALAAQPVDQEQT